MGIVTQCQADQEIERLEREVRELGIEAEEVQRAGVWDFDLSARLGKARRELARWRAIKRIDREREVTNAR